MSAREFRDRVELLAFRDTGTGGYNSEREFSEPVTCYGRLLPVTSTRLIDDVNSFGNERAVSHTLEMRARDDVDVFTYARHCGRMFRVYTRQEGDDRRFMTLGLIYERKVEVEKLSKSVFGL